MSFSQRSPATGPRLQPARDVSGDAPLFQALSAEPWLRLDPGAIRWRGSWLRIFYRSSFLDPLVRPILRIRRGASVDDVFLPGAVLGRGIWTGFVARDAEELWLSPAARPGPFGFDVERCEIFPRRRLLRHALRGSREKTLAWISASLRGMSIEAMEEITYALCHTPLSHYHAWRRKRARPFDIAGIDQPRTDWRRGPHIRLALRLREGSARFLPALLAGFGRQPYPNWSIALVGGLSAGDRAGLEPALASGRLVVLPMTAALSDLGRDLAPGDLVGRCAARDSLPESALAILAESAAQAPDIDVFYGDEDRVNRRGHASAPLFKPDWSPLFQAGANYLGAATFVRARRLAGASDTAARFADLLTPVDQVLPFAWPRVAHIRRVLLSRGGGAGRRAPPLRSSANATLVADTADPGASIIIPTRDRLDLLRACIDSLETHRGQARFETIVVDNGSVQPETLEWLAAVERRPGVRVLRRPGPFNFSALCNDGAVAARGATLVFLNNDTEALDALWLPALLAHTGRKDVGAVGGKLLFPSGRIQHAGVVIGLVGRAGHVFWGQQGDDSGYLGEIAAPREVAAVTGACLAVEAAKFRAIGGFNAGDLPIELNDIDLCLRLRERGFVNIYTPHCRLIHRESESRSRAAEPSRVYAQERAHFISRWAAAMRDDPYFHPALSLYTTRPALS